MCYTSTTMFSHKSAMAVFCLVILYLLSSVSLILNGVHLNTSDTPAPSWSSHRDLSPAPMRSSYRDLSPTPTWSLPCKSIPDCFQHILKMYAWLLAENKISVEFRCKLIQLFLKRSLFRRHDFSAMVDKLRCSVQKWHTMNLGGVSSYSKGLDHEMPHNSPEMPIKYQFYGGGPSLVFASDELLPYTSSNLDEMQYKFVRCVKTEDKHTLISEVKNTVLCDVPLRVLAPKLTVKCIKEIVSLHQMFMLARISVRDAQMLLQEHKCEKCDEFVCLFEPYKVKSNTQRQQNWYNKLNSDEKTAHLAEKSQYKESAKCQEINRENHKVDYWAKKEVKFPPSPPSVDLCQKIIASFCADTSPETFEEGGCAVCGKLTPVCEMEDLSDVENINLLKVDGVTRKARSKCSDPV